MMKWKGRRGSSNVEDRRGRGGGGGRTFIGGGAAGTIILLVVLLLGGNPGELLNSFAGTDTGTTRALYQETQEEKELAEFVSVVLADTEEVWTELFHEQGMEYEEPVLVLYTGSVQSDAGPLVRL